MSEATGGLRRPQLTVSDAVRIAHERYGVTATATDLGSNQDRNFLLLAADGTRRVLRIDHPSIPESSRDAQHEALRAYRAAGVPAPDLIPGLDGNITQHWGGYAARLSAYVAGGSLVDRGYLAPIVLEEFGSLAAASVQALRSLDHPGLDRENPWDLRRAHEELQGLLPAIPDGGLRERVARAAAESQARIEAVASDLPVQAIHGDLTDDNVIGRIGSDRRLHPHTVIDLGDLGMGWRVAELAVTVSSLLHHEPDRPLRALLAVDAFHRLVPLTGAETRALWPLVVLRAAHLVASGWRQMQIDGENAYARERIAGEQAIFDAATAVPEVVVTELILDRLGIVDAAGSIADHDVEQHRPGQHDAEGPLERLLPTLTGDVRVLDPGVESADLDGGAWLEDGIEERLAARSFADGAGAAVFPYGVYRLTRTVINSADAAATWPADTEIVLPPGQPLPVAVPLSGTVVRADDHEILVDAGAWTLRVTGVEPGVASGAHCSAGDSVALLPASTSQRRLSIGLRRADALPWTTSAPGCPQYVNPDEQRAWQRLAPDPAPLLGLPSHSQHDEAGAELQRRERIFASAQERYYENPMQVERGWRHFLVDTTGRAFVDMVNNVTGLGHGHPGVANAVNRQIRLLNTNSRFLYRDLAEYSERLLELLPDGSVLDTVLLVNSGSEAVDLALRLAQAATGRRTIVALREAYHGWTMASDAVTTSAFDNPRALTSRPDWVHIADVPNRFRGTYRGERSGDRYAADLSRDLEHLRESGRAVAGFICESVLGNAGGVTMPEGYLASAYELVREAGGVCIADEVQVGFGRLGTTFWGFEQSGVIPDIVTIAKPMGNGFPIGGVVTSKRIADALADEGQFFSSAGGNPLSCRVGIAVLDAMRDEGLQENARVIGERLRAGFEMLAGKHSIIGPIHGRGLYLGVELVRDRETLEPATQETAAMCERLRELGVIVLTTSERSNVLKIKPPLTLSADSADFILAQLDRVLTEGW